MTQAEIDTIKPGDVLKLKNPLTPASTAQRQRVVSIWTPFPGVRAARIEYYNVGNPSVLIGANDCELNLNLFGSSVME